MFENNAIIITTQAEKKRLLLNKKRLQNNKIYTLEEFYKQYYFTYDKEAIYFLMNKYQVRYEIASIYINNLYYIIENKMYKSEKLNFLKEIKETLLNEKKIKVNTLFRKMLSTKKIYFYSLPITKEIEKLIEELQTVTSVEQIKSEVIQKNHTIYEVKTMEEEVVYIASEICNLIKKNVSMSSIYITNIDAEYRKLIKKIFPMFHIPFVLKEDRSIYGTYLVKKFFALYESDISKTLEKLNEFVDNEETQDIYNKIVDIVNEYTFCTDKNLVKDMIKVDLKQCKLSNTDYTNAIHEVSFLDTIFSKNDYVFVCSFNQGILPSIHKDEQYLTDHEKEELGISLTVDLNNLEKNRVQEKLQTIENVILTFKLQVNGEEFAISNSNEVLKYPIKKIDTYPKEYSSLYNKIKVTSLLDEFYKYGTQSNLLLELNAKYKNIPYKEYAHIFSGIDKKELQQYVNNKLSLSYSSLDKYFRCPFSYYVGNILKLNIFEVTFQQVIGTLFHSILEKENTSSLSFEELWEQECNAIDYSFSKKEIFFLNKLKEELRFVIETIKKQENFTTLHDELHEEKIYTKIPGELDITFSGIIDKIKYKKEEDKTIAAIIDYKTGNPHIDITTLPYGIGMQLPIYLYLARQNKKLENMEIAGFYLQKIVNNETSVDNSHSYEQVKEKKLLLQGYSNENLDILSAFDTSYMDSNIIKSMRVKKDNSFGAYANVLSNKEMETITALAEEKIKEGAHLIENATFPIAPKKIGKVNQGCALCKFKDICFHTADDIVELEEKTKEEILGGEKDGLDTRTRESN